MAKERIKIKNDEDDDIAPISHEIAVDYPLTEPRKKAQKERRERDEANKFEKPEPVEAKDIDQDVNIVPPTHEETKDDVDPDPVVKEEPKKAAKAADKDEKTKK